MDRFKQFRIADEDKVKLVQLRTERFYADVDRLAESLREGRITLQMWEEEMRTQLRLFHTGMAAIGKGGWSGCTSSDWGKVGNVLKEQYGYLHRFAQDVYDRRETITAAAIAWRSRLYGDKGGYTAALIQAGDVTGFLPYLPRDGSTLCLNRCRCFWSLMEGDIEEGIKPVTATWVLTPAEHCATCIERDGHVEAFTVPAEMEVPTRIGGY